MAKKTYKIRVKIVFPGSVEVRAHDRKEAEAVAEKMAARLGDVQPLHEDIVNWDINIKASAVINRKEEKGGGL